MTATKTESETSLLQRILWVCNTVYHQVVAVVTFFIMWLFFKNYETDNKALWHYSLTTLAYIPLMADGIVLFAESNVSTLQVKRTTKYYLHGIFLMTSVLFLTVGIVLEIQRKNELGSNHFQTDHAITGLTSWVLSLLSVVLGVATSQSQLLKRIIPPVILKFIHNFLGFAAFAIGITSLCLGFYKGGFTRLVTTEEQKGVVWLVAIISVWSVFNAFVSGYNQLKTIFS